jgi:hypothetical protein
MIEALLEVRACVRTSQLSDALRQYLYDKYVFRGRQDRPVPAHRETERLSALPVPAGEVPEVSTGGTGEPERPSTLRRWAASTLGILALVGSVAVFLLLAWGGGAA